jgi:hypothetical protein
MMRFTVVLFALVLAAVCALYGYEFWRISRTCPPNWDARTMGSYAYYATIDRLGLLPHDGSAMDHFQRLIDQKIDFGGYLRVVQHCERIRCTAHQLRRLEVELKELEQRPIPQRF